VWADYNDQDFNSTAGNQFLIRATGGVGVGTNAPQDQLEESGGILALDSGPESALTGIRIREDDALRWTLLFRTSDDDDLEILDEVLGQSVMTFKSNTGRVGIGTDDPDSMLTVNGLIGTASGLKFPDGTVQTTASAGGGGSLWEASGNDILYNAGRVGVGTSTPGARLDVNGLARVQGSIWPSSGEGMELAYSSGLKKGYIQVFDRGTGEWGDLYLGNGNVGIGVGNPSAKLAVSGVIESTAGGIRYPDGTQQTTAAVACWDLNGNGIGDGAEDTNGDGSIDVLDCQGPPGPPTTTSALCSGRAQYPPAGACDAICTGLVVAEMRELQCSATADTGSCSSPSNFSYGLCCVCAP
jgi:hypothetical protein